MNGIPLAFILTRRSSKGGQFQPIQGSNIVPGIPTEQDSYRAELGGVMGILTTLELLCSFHHLNNGFIEIGLDGESALQAVFHSGPPTVDAKAQDLIRCIQAKLQALPLNITGRHIKGHQDKHKSYSQLDRWAKLNVQMDKAAKQLLAKVRDGDPMPNQALSSSPMTVSFRGQILSRISKQDMYTEIYGKEIKKKWQTYYEIPEEYLHDGIDWEGQCKALQKEPFGKRRFLVKFFAKQLAIGKNMLRRGHQDHSHCPCCDAPVEETLHIIQCDAPACYLCWVGALAHLDTWLSNERTEKHLRVAITRRLSEWRDSAPRSQVQGPHPLRKAIAAQDAIGWQNFLMGRISPSLASYQEVHYQHLKRRNTGKAWLHKTINQVWLILWKMWDN